MDDEIIEEMDVFLNNNVSSRLHVFQFPIGFSPLNEEEESLMGIKAKVESKKFQMEIKIDTASINYDRKKSEQIAYIAENEGVPFFPKRYMNKLILDSDELKPSFLQYAIGVIKHSSKELHLSPISSVIHFRPSFDYFDKTPKTTYKENIDEDFEENVKEDEIKKIIPRFERLEEERLKKAKETSFSFLTQKLHSEPWVDVNVNFYNSAASLIERQSLIYTQSNDGFTNGFINNNIFESMDNEQVLNSDENSMILVEDCLKSFIEPQTTHCISSLRKLKSLPLNIKVRTIMLNAKVISLSNLRQILNNSEDTLSIIRKLQECSMLVQGNWVVKSEILYPKEDGKALISPTTGIPIDILCRARDYIMWRFTQEKSLCRSELIKITKIPDQEVLVILKEMSILNKTTKLWDFMLPKDVDFIEKYPDIVQRQSLLWDARTSVNSQSSYLLLTVPLNKSLSTSFQFRNQ